MNSDFLLNSPQSFLPSPVLRISTVPFFVRTQLIKQINDLLASGLSVILVCSPGLKLDEFNHFGRLRIVDINISREISLIADIYALYKLTIFLFFNPVCIIHSTTPKAGLLAAIAGILSKTPLRFHTFTGQTWVNRRGITSWVAKVSDMIIARLNTFSFADSESQKNFLTEKYIVSPDNIAVIGAGSLAGIDLMKFNELNISELTKLEVRAKLGIPLNGFVFLYLGRITPSKGIPELLNAFKKISEEYDFAHLLLVGPVELGYKNEFYSAISAQHKIHITGYTDEPQKYISISQVLCLPSHREGFGTSVMEAAAMGVPAIGTNIYGLRDAILNEETGLLVELGDFNALVEAMKTMISDPMKKALFAELGRRRASELFNSDVSSARLILEYEKWATRIPAND